MLTIISDASIASAIGTNQLLAVAHRLLAEHVDEPGFNKVCIVRYGAGFMGRALRVELTRQPDRKITENWEWAGAAVGAAADGAAADKETADLAERNAVAAAIRQRAASRAPLATPQDPLDA